MKKLISTLLNIKRNSLLTFGFLLLTFSNSLKAQDDPYCGFLVDGVITSNIPSWNFKEMSIVIPITNEMLKFDLLSGCLKPSKIGEGQLGYVSVYFFLDKKDLAEYVDAKYMVVTIFKNGSELTELLGPGGKYPLDKRTFSTTKWCKFEKDEEPQKNASLSFQLKGYKITSYVTQASYGGNAAVKSPIYEGKTNQQGLWNCSCGTLVYEPKPLQYEKCVCIYEDKKEYKKISKAGGELSCDNCKLDATKSINVLGKKFTLNVEKIDFGGKFGKVKNGGGNAPSNSGNSKSESKTDSKSDNTKTDNSKKTTQTTPGRTMYLEKWDNGKVKIQGQKDKDDQLQGTWKYYDETGKLEKTEEWKDNELISTKEN